MAEDQPKAKKPRTREDYQLFYWPGIPGRGEPIRLALEEAGVEYEDVAYTRGVKAVTALLGAAHFAPPILKHKSLTISQLPNIMLYLGPTLGLAPEGDGLYRVNQLFLTLADLQNEAHDTHHPIAVKDYYEDQKDAALLRAKDFRELRIPKFFKHFEAVLAHNTASKSSKPKSSSTSKSAVEAEAEGEGEAESESDVGFLVGEQLTYADLMLFHVVDGLTYAFPNALASLRSGGAYPRLFALAAAVRQRPRIAAYLKSSRRQPFGNGLYRHYPELDDPPVAEGAEEEKEEEGEEEEE